jgi:hypothetical protein
VNVAHGHLLHFRQTWYADGYSLGDLLYSLPLAPGQKKLISVVEWERSETSSRSESTIVDERLDADLQRNRDILEVINGALSEQSRGGSTSSTWGVGTGTGGAGNGSYQGFNFGALFGISGGYSRADSEAWQNSSRNFASTSMNSLRDRVLQSASSVRGLRSTVVTTVGQTEAVRAETEVVANHNHCHALTIQYFEVLRHFQMRHDLVEVKECVFVPLPVTPFDRPKLLRWRDNVAAYLLRRDLAGGLEAVRRVETNWTDQPTPVGRYADESVVEISGELELEFQVYPPPLPDPDRADPAANAVEQTAGAILASIFFPPAAVLIPGAIASAASNAVADLKAQRTAALRYQKFHRDYMPRFAARFVNGFHLVVERTDGTRTTVNADFTLVSRYAADRALLVSFRAPVTGLARAGIAAVSVEAPSGVPDAVRCVVRALRAQYATDTFGHPLAESSRLNDDLDGPHLVPTGTFPAITFTLDPSTADPVRVRAPLDSWERRSPRAEDQRLATRLVEHVNANLEYYHHAVWWTMDPNRRYLLLDGFLAPHGGGRSIAQVVENRLIGIVGNSLVLPVAPGAHLDPSIRLTDTGAGAGAVADDAVTADPTGLFAYYAPTTPVPPARVSLPTKGVFAEAVTGACNSCERIDDSRFWRWEQSPIDEPPAIEPASTASRRATPEPATPTSLPAPLVTVQQAPAAPEPTDVAKLFEIIGRQVFTDITGLAGTQSNAAATYKINSDAALAYGKEASELAKQAGMLGAKDRAFAAIDTAEQDGKISADEAKDLRLRALRTMVGDSGGTDSDVDAAKKRLGVVDEAGKAGMVDSGTAKTLAGTILGNLAAGDKPRDAAGEAAAHKIDEMPAGSVSSVEVGRGQDTTKVEAGGGDTQEDALGIVVAGRNPADVRAFAPSVHDRTGVTALQATITGLPSGATVRWAAVTPGTVTFGSPDQPATTVQAGTPGPCDVRVEVVSAAGAVLRRATLALSVPQFVVIRENPAEFDAALTSLQLADVKQALLHRVDEVIRYLLRTVNVRVLWAMEPFNHVLPAFLDDPAVPGGLATRVTLRNTGPSAGLLGSTGNVPPAGPGNPREQIQIYPGGFLTPGAEVTQRVADTVNTLRGLNMTDPPTKSQWIETFGRMLGENIAHETMHSLLGGAVGPGGHHVPPIPFDLLNAGAARDFVARSGIELTNAAAFPAAGSFRDGGLGGMSNLTAATQALADGAFPVPPRLA